MHRESQASSDRTQVAALGEACRATGTISFQERGMAFGTPLVMRPVSLLPPKRSARLAEKPHSCSFPPEGDDQGVGTQDSPGEVTRSEAGNLGFSSPLGVSDKQTEGRDRLP